MRLSAKHSLLLQASLTLIPLLAPNCLLAFAPGASADDLVQTDVLYAQARHSDKDLPNFAVVDRGIYRGAAPSDAGLAKLKALGVQTIIDLRIEKRGQTEEAHEALKLGMSHLRIALGKEAPTKEQVTLFLSVLQNAARAPVYVHCQYGADRTGAMVGIYRVTQQGWTFKRAYAEMLRYGFKPRLTELKAAVQERAAAR